MILIIQKAFGLKIVLDEIENFNAETTNSKKEKKISVKICFIVDHAEKPDGTNCEYIDISRDNFWQAIYDNI